MPPVVRITASEEIYQTLREEILSLHFAPGEELNLQLLCEQLQVSRSPVRDALMKLSSDNLVDIFPQKGTRVSLINLKQVEEERFLRKSLEEQAVKKFIGCVKSKHFLKLESAIEAQEKAMVDKDFVKFLEADDQFHAIFFSAISLERIWNIIKAQGGNHHRIRLLSFNETNVLSNIIEQHQNMVEALKVSDLQTLLQLEDRHLSKLLQETEEMVKHYPQYFTQDSGATNLHVRAVNQ